MTIDDFIFSFNYWNSMKNSITIIGLLITSLALALSFSNHFNLTYIPSVMGFSLGIVLLATNATKRAIRKKVSLMFMIIILAMGITIFKSITSSQGLNESTRIEMGMQKM